MSCTRTRRARSVSVSFFLSFSSFCKLHLSFIWFYFFLSSFLSPPFLSTPIIDLRVAILFFFPRGGFFRRGPHFRLLRAAFFSRSLRTISLTSHIRIVISPVVGIGAPATTVSQPAGPCYKRVISGRKICNGMRDCRGSNEQYCRYKHGRRRLLWINFGVHFSLGGWLARVDGLGTEKVGKWEQG
jgi:hypothetical protein